MSCQSILIVSPDRAAAEAAFHQLRSTQCEVKLAYDAMAASQRLADWQPELIVVDDRISGVDGWNLAELLILEPVDPSARLVLIVESKSNSTAVGQQIDTIERDKPLAASLMELLSITAPSSTTAATHESNPLNSINRDEAITLRELLPVSQKHLGQIPGIASPIKIGANLAPRAVREPQLSPVPREQWGTQQPRASRQPMRIEPRSDKPADVTHPPHRPLSVGERYLVDAAFADYDRGKGA